MIFVSYLVEIPLGRMNPSVEDVHSIEAQAFQVCNTDGEEGLNWLEVEACEVLNHFPHKLCYFEDFTRN